MDDMQRYLFFGGRKLFRLRFFSNFRKNIIAIEYLLAYKNNKASRPNHQI